MSSGRRPSTPSRRLLPTGGLVAFACAALAWMPVRAEDGGKALAASAAGHWAFQPLRRPDLPSGTGPGDRNAVDRFLGRALAEAGIPPQDEADRATLLRRVAFVLTGLPPSPEEVAAFLDDRAPDAYERMVDRHLASPRHGERWAKHWLDAAGYADSNGYFNADTDRPLAYRYRDHVIRSVNRDTPFDRFVREQVAGDELSGWKPGQPATPEVVEMLEATHFLRNGQDGSGESDGNPDEVRTDRYYALESTMQVMGSCLLGLTVQCAKCHDHKFEPLTQRDYYAFQSFLYPAFNVEKWANPNDRVVQANLPGELEAWQQAEARLDRRLADARASLSGWTRAHRHPGEVLFADAFDGREPLAARWSDTAPGDDKPAGSPPVRLDSDEAPAARVRDGVLRIVEGGGSGDRWLSTRKRFDWRPARKGGWVQATFDLVATRLDGKGKDAERVGYVVAAHDFDDSSDVPGGNLLVDGNPGGATAVHVDYPGPDAKGRGNIGGTGYRAGRNYGVRITRAGDDAYRLEHLVDGLVDGAPLELKAADLPPGGFAFEYCCGRSFVVDNVVVEASRDEDAAWAAAEAAHRAEAAERQEAFARVEREVAAARTPKPGRIAWTSDRSPEPPEVHLLRRGNHKTPGEKVEPAFPAFLADGAAPRIRPPASGIGTGRRTAWAEWLFEPGSRQAALVARVAANRAWMHCFGTGIVATPDNLGLSGAPPSNPGLLEWLASELVASGWRMKHLERTILLSAAFRRSGAPRPDALAADPANRLLWRHPLRRLDAESVRDAMLAAAGVLGPKAGGPYVPTPRNADGEVVVDEASPAGLSRAVFLQQRRTQVPTMLANFDAPSIVFNCTRRPVTTMPLQSLTLLNSGFALARGEDLARRVARECGDDERARITRAFVLACGRGPDPGEQAACTAFLDAQRRAYAGKADAAARAWADLCQSLFGLNAFLYLE